LGAGNVDSLASLGGVGLHKRYLRRCPAPRHG
jgi:hypothetical protein